MSTPEGHIEEDEAREFREDLNEGREDDASNSILFLFNFLS
jgi:hypothetical protein